jgi:hypothetical protein
MFNDTETMMAFPGITVDRFGNFRCAECERFVSASEQAVGRSIKHARHCESQAQAVSPKAAAAPTIETGLPLNTVGNGSAEDEFHRVHSRNPKDWNRAMNRDD